MENKNLTPNYKRRDIALSICFSVALILCILPSFNSIGKLDYQILTTFAFSIIISVLSLLFRNGVRAMGISLLIFLSAMLLLCLVVELSAQINSSQPFKQWIYIFYYDKPMTVAFAWSGVFFTYTVIRLFLPASDKYINFVEGYNSFLKTSVLAFFIFYICLLFYGFVIIRTNHGYSSEVNLVPLRSILSYLNGQISVYESFMYFSGNLLIFAPFGFFIPFFLKNAKWYILLFLPIILSSAIELSQHLLRNGSCDIDDVILNVIGFYLGVLLFKALNLLRKVITKGGEATVFHR
jgi:glycopeptide antibiotics resistance protein